MNSSPLLHLCVYRPNEKAKSSTARPGGPRHTHLSLSLFCTSPSMQTPQDWSRSRIHPPKPSLRPDGVTSRARPRRAGRQKHGDTRAHLKAIKIDGEWLSRYVKSISDRAARGSLCQFSLTALKPRWHASVSELSVRARSHATPSNLPFPSEKFSYSSIEATVCGAVMDRDVILSP